MPKAAPRFICATAPAGPLRACSTPGIEQVATKRRALVEGTAGQVRQVNFRGCAFVPFLVRIVRTKTVKRLPAAFYELPSAREPAREWLKSQSEEDRKIIGEDIKYIEFG